ncbi:CsbD family protein [Neobacillus sp. DY30]|uniref:CsbD family protein n=1 Tax=Neobacillus sp. DY30 TaxID=3047871 RepID=UPI0024BFAE7B|nr:CsbD family protein [Neobacillus sp. DY30]WHY00538.1 CsbD family protein [Neobacillus sp. DY30]
MNKDKMNGFVDTVKGKAKEEWGRLTDDRSTKNEGKVDQAKGRLQEEVGRVKDKITKNY